mmetsp:Transcript_14040/g.23306  ORF Transcript_14040/g.23306 Transcript_14040/m.23306 type:complete len:214 (+) Transcript_14040:280-921(+)
MGGTRVLCDIVGTQRIKMTRWCSRFGRSVLIHVDKRSSLRKVGLVEHTLHWHRDEVRIANIATSISECETSSLSKQMHIVYIKRMPFDVKVFEDAKDLSDCKTTRRWRAHTTDFLSLVINTDRISLHNFIVHEIVSRYITWDGKITLNGLYNILCNRTIVKRICKRCTNRLQRFSIVRVGHFSTCRFGSAVRVGKVLECGWVAEEETTSAILV